jgi:hypothetical protein
LLFQFDLLRHKRILQFFEFLDVNRAFREAIVNPVNLGFERRKLGFETVNFLLLLLRPFRFPGFDPRKKLLLPFVGNGSELRVALHFLREFLLANKAAVFALLVFAFLCATIIVEAKAALFDMPFGGDAISAGAASGEIEEKKFLFRSVVTRFGDGNEP